MLDDAKILASDIMTRDVAVVRPETTLLAAVKLMAARRISGLPVVDQHEYQRVPVMRVGKLVGIVTRADLVRALAQKLSEMEPSLPPIPA